MRVLYVLMAVIQFSFAFHAMKTGRGAMWITIIIVFPVVGCIAYYFMEVFPNTREERAVRKHVRDIAKALDPDGELKRRAEELEQTASVENKSKLGDECLERGMFDEAIKLYEGCLIGPHANDPGLLFSLARARFYNGEMRPAEEIIEKLIVAHPKFQGDEVLLLRARVDEALGATQRALNAYEALRARYVGFEAKYRYGLMLKRLGRDAEAHELFNFIGSNAKRATLDSEQQWVKLAAEEREKVAA
jgi:hypothetical protein